MEDTKKVNENVGNGRSRSDSIKQGPSYRITILSDRLVRLEYSKSGDFNDSPTDFAINRNFPKASFTIEEDETYLIINTKYFNLQYMKNKSFKGPSFAPDAHLKVKLLNTDKVWYYGHPEARNFLSTAFSLDDFSGGSKKLERGLYSTDGFVSIEDSKPIIIGEDGTLSESTTDSIDVYLFMYKRDFGLCLKDYFTLTGYPPLIPRYALGLWWYRDIIYTQDDTTKLIEMFEEKEIPINVLMLGEYWHKKDKSNNKTGFTFSDKLFYDPEKFIKDMHEKNVRVGLNVDPVDGITPLESVYEEANSLFSVKNGKNIPLNIFDSNYVNFYFEKLIEPLMNMDVDFLWLDYQSYSLEFRMLNYYHFNHLKNNTYKRPLLFSRNSTVAGHRYGVHYSGQTIVNWNTLKYLPFYNASSSNIGISWWSHDIGGFKEGIEDSELYMRYCQFATYSPIFRLSAKRGIYYKREPWFWDYTTYNIVKSYIDRRQKLIPYIYNEGYNYHKTGLPLVQPLYYVFPEAYDEPNYRNEYFFGRNLFVCPITSMKDNLMNRVIQRLFLPKGIWYEVGSGKKFVGGKRYITFYKDEDYPVFAPAGAILPMTGSLSTFNQVDNPENLDIVIFPGKSSNYKLYEDDGLSSLYKDGFYHITSIDFNYTQDNYTVFVKPDGGKAGIIPSVRTFNIIFKNTDDILNTKVLVGNEKYDNYETDIVDKSFVVRVKDVDSTKPISVNVSGDNIEIDTARILNDDINEIINDLKIKTELKEKIAKIVFGDKPINKKRIEIRKLKRHGLDGRFIQMFMKLYDYLSEI